jgi:predicted DNA-binding ribbon-helix-helix protein
MKSTVIKRSVVFDGRKTSVTLEDAFWDSLHEIAHQQHKTVSQLVARIDAERKFANLSSNLRLFVLAYACQEGPTPRLTARLPKHPHGAAVQMENAGRTPAKIGVEPANFDAHCRADADAKKHGVGGAREIGPCR